MTSLKSMIQLEYADRLVCTLSVALLMGLLGGLCPVASAMTPHVDVPHYTDARELVKDSEYLSLSRASRFLQKGQSAAALNDLVTTVERNPVNILGLFHMGNAYLDLAKNSDIPEQRAVYLEQAQEAFERVVDLNDDLTLVYFKLGKVALMKEDPATARHYYEMGLSREPRNAALIFNLARVYDQTGEKEKAIAYYMKTIAVDPAFIYAYNNLALLYEEDHHYQEAAQTYRQALKHDRNYNLARLNLGNMLASTGDYKGAQRILNEAQAREPGNEWVYYYLGNLYLRMGAYDQAVTAYSRAVEINPNHATTYYLLAVSLTKLKKMDEALQASLHYVHLEPDGEYAKELQGLIMSVKLSQLHGLYLTPVSESGAAKQ